MQSSELCGIKGKGEDCRSVRRQTVECGQNFFVGPAVLPEASRITGPNRARSR